MLTEKSIIKSLQLANNKWLDVKVILEKNPYQSNWINDSTYDFLLKNHINIVWSNLENYALNHSKFIIIDDEIILASWNFTNSTFNSNRDIFLFIRDREILSLFEKVFNFDFKWIKTSPYSNFLVISPDYSRNKIEKMIFWAKDSINMYFPYIDDENLESILLNKATNWVKIRLITDKLSLKQDLEKMEKLKKSWIEIKALKRYTEHWKAILIDEKYLYIWSENFSTNSLDKNRETWILLKNTEIIKSFRDLFEKDFK
jgi:phosphatidylserine/phosphatidylglycerophosphate/cardiolipin synthase-like enzyme